MKWQKVFKVYIVSEDGLLKSPKDKYGYPMFDSWYNSHEEAIRDIQYKTEGDLIFNVPDQLHIIPCLVKVLE